MYRNITGSPGFVLVTSIPQQQARRAGNRAGNRRGGRGGRARAGGDDSDDSNYHGGFLRLTTMKEKENKTKATVLLIVSHPVPQMAHVFHRGRALPTYRKGVDAPQHGGPCGGESRWPKTHT